MITEILLLSCIGLSSYYYTLFFVPSVSNIISVDQHYMILCFSCILLVIDNLSLFNDLQTVLRNKKNNKKIEIIGNQVIELVNHKIITYDLNKIKEEQRSPNKEELLENYFLKKSNSSSDVENNIIVL